MLAAQVSLVVQNIQLEINIFLLTYSTKPKYNLQTTHFSEFEEILQILFGSNNALTQVSVNNQSQHFGSVSHLLSVFVSRSLC